MADQMSDEKNTNPSTTPKRISPMITHVQTYDKNSLEKKGFLNRVINFIGTDNLTLFLAWIVLVFLISVCQYMVWTFGRIEILYLAESDEQSGSGSCNCWTISCR